MSGVVVLSWTRRATRRRTAAARGNVVLHELAHILDAEDGIFDGQPLHDDPDQGKRWAATLQREFAVQRAAVDAGEDASLDEYATRNYAEFFAVATEASFCTPFNFASGLPELYRPAQPILPGRSERLSRRRVTRPDASVRPRAESPGDLRVPARGFGLTNAEVDEFCRRLFVAPVSVAD